MNKEQQTREEKVIDGVLHFRTFPTRAWKPYPIKYLTHEIESLRQELSGYHSVNEVANKEIDELKAKIVLLETKNDELEDEIDRLRLGDEY